MRLVFCVFLEIFIILVLEATFSRQTYHSSRNMVAHVKPQEIPENKNNEKSADDDDYEEVPAELEEFLDKLSTLIELDERVRHKHVNLIPDERVVRKKKKKKMEENRNSYKEITPIEVKDNQIEETPEPPPNQEEKTRMKRHNSATKSSRRRLKKFTLGKRRGKRFIGNESKNGKTTLVDREAALERVIDPIQNSESLEDHFRNKRSS